MSTRFHSSCSRANRGLALFALLTASAMPAGCALMQLDEELQRLQRAGSITGQVVLPAGSPRPVVVGLYEPDGTGSFRPVAHWITHGAGQFDFLCRPGTYFVVAFEDANEDLAFQPSERVGWHGTPDAIEIAPGTRLADLEIVLRDAEDAQRELPYLYSLDRAQTQVDLDLRRIGEIVTLDDERLAPAAGVAGMWEPVKFVERGHNGIFFLEPFDAAKKPVLFIHGISGCGSEWRHLVNGIDRSRFQPWIVQYPSGMRLELVSKHLYQSVLQAQLEHRFESLMVVAHSMGGLVARDFVNRAHRDGNDFVELFVTLSSPWGGHHGARTGVEHSPVVVPSWYDVASDSPFLTELFQTPLHASTPHYLMFGYRGPDSFFGSENSDGVITLASQLAPEAQSGAARLLGYDEGHSSILRSAAVLRDLRRLMAAQ